MTDQKTTIDAARAAKSKARDAFANVGHVCGVGITYENDQYAVRVNLEQAPPAESEVPKEIDGVPIVVHVVGRIRKQVD